MLSIEVIKHQTICNEYQVQKLDLAVAVRHLQFEVQHSDRADIWHKESTARLVHGNLVHWSAARLVHGSFHDIIFPLLNRPLPFPGRVGFIIWPHDLLTDPCQCSNAVWSRRLGNHNEHADNLGSSARGSAQEPHRSAVQSYMTKLSYPLAFTLNVKI